MKQIFKKIAILLISITAISNNSQAIDLTAQSGTISLFGANYVDNMHSTWTINIGANEKLNLRYSLGTEYNWDFVYIYEFDASGNLNSTPTTTLSGFTNGTIITSIPNGKVQIEFVSDGAGCAANHVWYTGFQIDYEIDKTAFIQRNLDVNNNTFIRGDLEVFKNTTTSGLHVNVQQPTLGSNVGDYVPLTTTTGNSYNLVHVKDYILRESGSAMTDWNTASYIRGVSVGTSFSLPNTTLRSWIKQKPFTEKIEFGSSGTTYMSVGNSVGIGTTAPSFRFHIRGGNANSDQMTLGATTTGNFALTSADGGAYGLFGGVSDTGRAWLQTGRYDTNTAYDLSLQAAGGNVGIGTTDPKAKLDVAGNVKITDYSPTLVLQRNTNEGGFTEGIQTKLQDGTDNWFFGALHTGQWIVSKGNFENRKMTILENGCVGIGTTTPSHLLSVKGTIRAKEVIVDLCSELADYVFHPTYNLMPLTQVEQYVKTNSHLPEMPSAAEVSKNGMNMGEMQNKLLQKVEELTLYMIQQQKTIEAQNSQIKQQNAKIDELSKKIK